MQTFNHTGKPRFIVSNRVFWACVVLAAAALLGRNTGQAAPPIPAEIKAHQITIVNPAGKPVIFLGALKDGSAAIRIEAGASALTLMALPKNDAAVTFERNSRTVRSIRATPAMDSGTPAPQSP